MRNEQTDPRLDAANLTQEDFIGEIEDSGDASPSDELVEHLQKMNRWTMLNEHNLLEPCEGYVLRYNVPSDSHCIYLLHDNEMVGFFHETDSLVIHSEHQGKGLGKELVLAAFAQKPWKKPQRKATSAGKRTLENAYRLACRAQQRLSSVA
jgi:GNAT superfamily N-acetyltransferase